MPSTQTIEQRLRDATAHVETEIQRLIAYVNDEVVPDVRRHGSEALRSAATELDRLARHMEEVRKNPPPPPAPRP